MLTSRLWAHPRRTLLAVLAFVIVAGVLGGPVAGALKTSGGFVAPGADSEVALERIESASGTQADAGIVLLVDGPSRTGVTDVATRLGRIPGVARTATPGRAGERASVAATLRAGADDDAAARTALRTFAGRRDVTVGGPAVANVQIGDTVSGDLGRAELIAFPFLILLSVVFFRGRAALMPLAVGVTTVLGTFLVLSGINQVYGLNVFALNLVIGLGLGLAIDYTLFLVTRYREELDTRGAGPEAIRATMRSAGRTVAFSAVTVACALITLTVFPQAFLKSMGIAGATVALVAAVAALVVSPALLALWGAKLARPGHVGGAGHDRWHRLAHAVMRRPGAVAAVTTLAMLAVALPALGTTWSAIDASAIPKDKSARVVADALERGSDGAAKGRVTVAVSAPASARAEVETFAGRVARLDGVARAAPPVRSIATRGSSTRWPPATRPGRRPSASSRASAICPPGSTSASGVPRPSSSTSSRRSARGCSPRSRCSAASRCSCSGS